MNLHMFAKFGANWSCRLVAFSEFVPMLVRLLAAVRADSCKTRQKTIFIHRKSYFRPEHADINVTNFLHSNFLSVLWRARGGVNDIVPACND